MANVLPVEFVQKNVQQERFQKMIQEAKSKGLSLKREAFQESGRRVTLYKGVRAWFGRINAYGDSVPLRAVT